MKLFFFPLLILLGFIGYLLWTPKENPPEGGLRGD
jgi:hypothetical protein